MVLSAGAVRYRGTDGGANRGRASKYLRATMTKSFHDASALLAGRLSTDSRSGGSSRWRRRCSQCRYRRQWRPRLRIYLVTSINNDTTAGRADDRASLASRSSAANLGEITQGDRGNTFKFSTWNYARSRD